MNYLAVLNQAVNASLDSGRIGVPVFVRWTASVAESKDVLKTQLIEMAGYTSHWLSASVRRLYTTGSESQGHLSLSLEYVSGASALLALTLAHDHPHMSLAIYGNQGALYHNEFIAPIRDGLLSPLPLDSHTMKSAEQDALLFMAAIEQSLARHQPVELAHGGGRP